MTKKLLQLNVTANWGSTGKITESIGQAAIARGWESAIAYGRMMNPSKSELIKVGNPFSVYLHYARNRFLDGEGLGSKKPTKCLIKQIKEYNPSIIHLHNIHDHWLNYPILFNYLASVETPIVWTFHDCWAFTGGCAHFENIGCEMWKDGDCSEKCPQIRGRIFTRRDRNFQLKRNLIMPLSSRITVVGVSEWITNFARQSFLKDCEFATINNGVDLKIFSLNNIQKDRLVLGVSNVWPPYKGLTDFIELRKELPNNIKICLVGLTKRQIDILPEGIIGIERTKNVQELVDLYNRASVFVNPTYNDTFPTVNIEALACGTPVVTYRAGGSPEAIDDNTGVVVEKGNVDALAKAILMVLDNHMKYNSDVCCKRAESYFNKDVQFNKYIELYESLVK